MGMSLWLGITVVAYFVGGPQLLAWLAEGAVPPTTAGFILFVAGLALFDFGWFREQFCHYVCPYARFQGAMFDRDSLLVAYDARRGEPRGKVSDPSAGSCVDCTLCVQVCPMGIDIRNGQQLECITCAACIDACDAVMDRVGRPRGLVRYTSLKALEGEPTTIVRGRLVLYALLLLGLAGLFFGLLAVRSPLVLDVVRQGAGGVSGRTADGRLSNVYALKITNRQGDARNLRLELAGFPGAELVVPEEPVSVASETLKELRVLVVHPGTDLRPVTRFAVVLTDLEDPSVRLEARTSFLAPGLETR